MSPPFSQCLGPGWRSSPSRATGPAGARRPTWRRRAGGSIRRTTRRRHAATSGARRGPGTRSTCRKWDVPRHARYGGRNGLTYVWGEGDGVEALTQLTPAGWPGRLVRPGGAATRGVGSAAVVPRAEASRTPFVAPRPRRPIHSERVAADEFARGAGRERVVGPKTDRLLDEP